QEYIYQFDKYSFKVGNNYVEVDSGEIKGLIDVRDEIEDYKVNKLDKLVQNLKNQVNNLHMSGYDANGNDGIAFFEFESGEYDAGHLVVNQLIQDDYNKVVASSSSDPDETANKEIAEAILRLRNEADTIEGTTFQDFWLTQTGSLGLEIDRADRMESNQEIMIGQLNTRRQEISGLFILRSKCPFSHSIPICAMVCFISNWGNFHFYHLFMLRNPIRGYLHNPSTCC
ncbi:unnamed protein product, partial [marine sediment metagenome]